MRMSNATIGSQLQGAAAGHCGGSVRSDCRVSIEPTTSGGIQLSVKSRVASYYGDSIREQVLAIVDSFEVTDANVAIEDEGALPFVIAARVEAALRSAGYIGSPNDSTEFPRISPSAQDRLRRSRLYLPGSEPKYFINAALHEPDAIILDLEDSVHPNDKFASRILVRNALQAIDFDTCERMVRINQAPIGWDDLDEIVPKRPDLILIPKIENAHQVQDIDRRISTLEREHGIDHKIWLMPIIESALGIENAYAIAIASDRNVALTIGLEDYTADLGVPKTKEGYESLYARLRVVNAARAANLQAIDSVYGDVGDLEGLRSWGERSRGLGFEGMGCVHPSQIEVIHRAFSPTGAEIQKAAKIVEAFNEAQAAGRSVISVGSKMIDPPVVHRAQVIMKRATALGLVGNEANGL
jgi:citrate lyase subunit beta / citryl-CoA lyase